MLTLEPSIDVSALAQLVATEWGASDPLQFVPVGGDSWCFAAAPWWISVRRDRGGHCAAAYEVAAGLPARGLEFVLAPVPGRSGAVVAALAHRPVVAFPLVAGDELHPTERSPAHAATLAEMVRRLHEVGNDGADLPRERFTLEFERELDAGLTRAREDCGAYGPYGAAVESLVRSNEVRLEAWRDEMRTVRQRCLEEAGPFVLTHGEPSNVFVRPDGELLLMDWGTLAWGPPERDWWALVELGIAWPATTRPHVRRYYELRWILSEIAEYVDRFTTPHPGDVGDDDKWSELLLYLSAPT